MDEISKEQLMKYLENVDNLFPVPLSAKCNLEEFANKLLLKATLCPEIWDGEVVGLVAGYTDNLVNNMAYITTVAVDKKVQRHGIAYKLIDDFCKVCQKKKINKVHLYTDKSNIQAIQMYRKIGFTDFVLENEPRPDDLHLVLDIGEAR